MRTLDSILAKFDIKAEKYHSIVYKNFKNEIYIYGGFTNNIISIIFQ